MEIDPEVLINILSMNRSDLFNKYGNDYSVVYEGAEGTTEGYCYKNLGISVFFSDDCQNVLSITCDNKVDLAGVRAGMNFKQIQDYYGKTDISEDWIETPDNKIYTVTYELRDYILQFTSSNSDGSNSTAEVIAYTPESENNTSDNTPTGQTQEQPLGD